MSDAEIEGIHQDGFDFVRLTVDPGVFLESAAHEPEAIGLLRQKVEQFLRNDVNVVVDIQPVDNNPLYQSKLFVEDIRDSNFAKYTEMVGRVADALSGYPSDHVALELMNEPPVGRNIYQRAKWNEMLDQLHNAARAKAPTLLLILSGGDYGHIGGLVDLDPTRFKGSNVAYTFHYYEPDVFTHQRIPFYPTFRYLGYIKFPPERGGFEAAFEQAEANIQSDLGLSEQDRRSLKEIYENQLRDYFNADPYSKIKETFRQAGAWADKYGIPRNRIYLGEFGVVRDNTRLGFRGIKDDDSIRWLRAVRSAAESEGFFWSVWGYFDDALFSLNTGRSGAVVQAAVESLALNRPNTCSSFHNASSPSPY
jgi:endoglucanase